MTRQKKNKTPKPKLLLKQNPNQSQKPEDLEEFIREASEVRGLTQQAGWGILERDLNIYRNEIANKLAYISPKRPEFEEARILFLASDKIINMINDYAENKDKAIELLNKIQNPDLAVTMDVDNEETLNI